MSETEDIFDDSVVSGEYVLGVLDADERARLLKRAQTDEAFAALVAGWEKRLMPLALEAGVMAPPSALKNRIMAVLFADAASTAKSPSPLLAALNFWRLAAAGMAALALLSSAALVYFTTRPAEILTPQLVATILPPDASPILSAELDEELTLLQIKNAAIDLAEDQNAELWLIPADGTPRSLGLIRSSGTDSVQIPQALRQLISAGAVLAVSLEPIGGSPTGAPTGPVIGVGALDTP